MNEKPVYLGLVGAALITGFLLGRVLATVTASGGKLWRILNLVGTIILVIGLVAAEGDHRFWMLSAVGLCMQVAGITLSFKK